MPNCNLYVILDAQVRTHEQLLAVAREAARAGAGIFQLRDKTGSDDEILTFAQRFMSDVGPEALFIVNDRPDLAVLSGADGVHLGQEDLQNVTLGEVRKMLGEGKILGVSCQTLGQVRQAQARGADYIGFGSVFKTFTKPDRQPMDLELLAHVLDEARVPVFPIGGITPGNVDALTNMGLQRAAVCRAVCEAADVAAAVKNFEQKIRNTESEIRNKSEYGKSRKEEHCCLGQGG